MRRKREYTGSVIPGQVFGRWTVIKILGTVNKKRGAKVRCECGTVKETSLYTITSGQSKSCGCLQKEVAAEWGRKHKKHGLKKHPLYTIWCNIKRRCYIPDAPFYHLYGGKGVKVCDEWFNNFQSFYDWCLSNGWKRGLQIDKDLLSKQKPGKLYSPDTCSIITQLVNIRNRTTTQMITYLGETLSVQEWGERINISYKLMWQRLNEGWTLERMIKEPGKVVHENLITHNGETLGITEWGRKFNITVGSIKKRLKKGWNIQQALETPVDTRFVTNKKSAA